MYDRELILKELREHVMEVSFTKVNGDNRIMRCTLRKDLLPPTYIAEETKEKTFHKENPDVIAAWDVQANGWRSFRIDSVSYLQDVSYSY
jgi:hypothetical protein